MGLNRFVTSLIAICCLGSAGSARADIVINWAVSDVRAAATVFGGSVNELPAPFNARTVTVLPSNSTLSSTVGPYTPNGSTITSFGSVSASQQASFSTAPNGGLQLSRTASVSMDGQSYASTNVSAEVQVNFTVVGNAETLSGQLLSAALTQNAINAYNPPYPQFWNFVASSSNPPGLSGGFGASTVGSMGSALLQPGTYTGYATTSSPSVSCVVVSPCSWDYLNSSTMSILFPNATFAPGATQLNPLLPNGTTPGGRPEFEDVPRLRWYDPEVASGFDFETTDGSKFTKIVGLPTGFDDLFEVIAEGGSLGTFGPSDGLDFVALLGHGVNAFSIRNIRPGVDPNSPTAFPIALDFDAELASFTMTPAEITQSGGVPEPATLVLLGLGLAGIGVFRRKSQATPT